MNPQQAAVARLALSRERLRRALVERASANAKPTFLGGLVREHPLGSAGVAVALGALVAWLRPWRWVLKPRLWSSLLSTLAPTLVPAVVAVLATAPIGDWAELLMGLLRRGEPGAAATDAPPDAPQDVPHEAPMNAPLDAQAGLRQDQPMERAPAAAPPPLTPQAPSAGPARATAGAAAPA